ncbi:minor capsid protein [Anaerosacchariphilus polymeriproducens]|uniref:Capsid protein n=1 Tax=Anaerosacchariphilus polymeriproducens TaxID=1812858 RepID=A0A371AQS4_9FIRM|nr:minor capsid protein [Anaerosacchariphilus polymeriproducens]RDU21937.1 hypothetical protein DWV06_15480 [Anaerosacchariphilus polymeriproducens]
MDFKLNIKPVEVIKKNHNMQNNGKVQRYIDSECIRLMAPYTPFKQGVLEKSATAGTKIGSGQIKQNAPYARYQYYGKLMVSSVTGSAWASQGESKVLTGKDLIYNTGNHPRAGKKWFERMKTDHRKSILKGAQRIANRG